MEEEKLGPSPLPWVTQAHFGPCFFVDFDPLLSVAEVLATQWTVHVMLVRWGDSNRLNAGGRLGNWSDVRFLPLREN